MSKLYYNDKTISNYKTYLIGTEAQRKAYMALLKNFITWSSRNLVQSRKETIDIWNQGCFDLLPEAVEEGCGTERTVAECLFHYVHWTMFPLYASPQLFNIVINNRLWEQRVKGEVEQGAQRQGRQGKVREFSWQGMVREKSGNLICGQGKSLSQFLRTFCREFITTKVNYTLLVS